MAYGADKGTWESFRRLALEDIRPVVSNMDTPTGKGVPSGKLFTKTPAAINADGKAHLIKGWQQFDATEAMVTRWQSNPEHGIGCVARRLKAIDIDVDDVAFADELDEWFCNWFNADLPRRVRNNSGRRMLIYRVLNQPDGAVRSKVVYKMARRQDKTPVEDGYAVEFLFDRNFFVAGGTHHSGAKQVWEDLPDEYEQVPAIEYDKLEAMLNAFADVFSERKNGTFFTEVDARHAQDVNSDDALYKFVVNSDWYLGEDDDGKVFVRCPFEELHSSDGSEDQTVFFPAGLGGRTEPGFKCLHTNHSGRGEVTLDDFKRAIGYTDSQFDVVHVSADAGAEQAAIPKFVNVTKTGVIPSTAINVNLALTWPHFPVALSYDPFADAIRIRYRNGEPWRHMVDTDYEEIMIILNRMNFSKLNRPDLRSAVRYAAGLNQIDSGQAWINSLVWDGRPRIANFSKDVLKAINTPYAVGTAMYMFTAMAGRLLVPGEKADIVPVFISRQGTMKSTLIKELAPFSEWHTTMAFDERDADASRKMKGRMVIEIPEMKGVNTKEIEAIRAFITKTEETYVPKFQEMAITYRRRALMIGTDNKKKFLTDPTGNRRFNPLNVAETGSHLDVDYVRRNRDQLFAEARHIYMEHGVMWKVPDANEERKKFESDTWMMWRVRYWLETGLVPAAFTISDVMTGAFGAMNVRIQTGDVDSILDMLGYVDVDGRYIKKEYADLF